MSGNTLSDAKAFVDAFNTSYEEKHTAFENQDPIFDPENLSRAKTEMENLLSNPETLQKAQKFRSMLSDANDLTKVLDCIIKTCQCYSMPNEAKLIREETAKLESNLEMARNRMELGYTDETGRFVKASSVGLRNKVGTDADESTRKSCYEALCSIGPFVLDNGFLEIIKLRNKLAMGLGFEDYYEYKLVNAEGFGKSKLFDMLDGLEQGTRPIMEKARDTFAQKYGKDGLNPWNMAFKMRGSIVVKMDPYFPFSKAVERYARSYSAMNISYEGATMNLDLLDRPKKYSNGFCHWPRVAWKPMDKPFIPSTTNFTSLADPVAVGSGLTALRTLMHEAGVRSFPVEMHSFLSSSFQHAAHFANIKQPSPLFGQERAPTSVAYAENQSMFLDSLVSDAAWRATYARDKSGTVIPFEILEEEIRATHPFAVFQIRSMLAVSYFEKALYELPEDQVTKENIIQLAERIEVNIQGGKSVRPMLSIPHLVSDEASCYYHGYTLAEMSVYQTRSFFLKKYGFIVDNPEVGPTLTKAYWECGNSKPFLKIVADLTGKELSGDDWVNHVKEGVEDKVLRSKNEYMEAKAANADRAVADIDLNMTVRFVDGDELIADSSSEGGLMNACKKFEAFVEQRIAAK